MQSVRRAFLIRKIRSVNGQVAIVRDDLENLYSCLLYTSDAADE